MKLFIRNADEEELIFIPSFLLVDNFEKLLRKKDTKFKIRFKESNRFLRYKLF